ncbi:sensor histidine kinase [Campylobacterota bacterium DY0563]
MILEDTIDKKYFDTELKLITDYSQYLSSTIDDFRNFFKSDKEKVVFELNDIIEKSLSIIKTSLDSRSISLIKNLDNNYNLYTYPSELQQVILNLLKNAEDALIDKKDFDRKIYISTYKKDEKTVVINIADNGGGIKESIIEKIFDPYFSTKNKKDGTGLGLYMSKIIINEHCNGNLKVANKNNGAVFSIELPVLQRKEKKNVE